MIPRARGVQERLFMCDMPTNESYSVIRPSSSKYVMFLKMWLAVVGWSPALLYDSLMFCFTFCSSTIFIKIAV